MSKKGRTLALAVSTATLIGLGAPMASAATAGGPGDSGLVNVSHNQAPVQICGNKIPVNVLGVQIPVSDLAASLGLLSPGLTGAQQNSSCHQGSAQNNGTIHVKVHKGGPCCQQRAAMPADPAARVVQAAPVSALQDGQLFAPAGLLPGSASSDPSDPSGDSGGLVNVSHNQVPVQICGNKIPVNVLGVQIPVSEITAVLGLMSSGPTLGSQDSSCHQGSAQNN